MYNDIYKTYATESYADIQNQAKRNKENWIGIRDPILQRTDNYVCFYSLFSQNVKKEYKQTTERTNYHNYIQEKEIKRSKSFLSKTTKVHLESEYTPSKKGIRTFKDIKNQTDLYKRDHSGIKIVQKPNASIIGKVLASDDDCPVYKERFHFKKAITGGIPSKDYTTMNNRRMMLPHQVKRPKTERNGTPNPVSESYKKIFGHMEKNNNTITLKVNLCNVNEKYRNKKDHVKNIINTTPKYRDIYYTDKPNRVKYQTIKKQLAKNKEDEKNYHFVDKDDYQQK